MWGVGCGLSGMGTLSIDRVFIKSASFDHAKYNIKEGQPIQLSATATWNFDRDGNDSVILVKSLGFEAQPNLQFTKAKT